MERGLGRLGAGLAQEAGEPFLKRVGEVTFRAHRQVGEQPGLARRAHCLDVAEESKALEFRMYGYQALAGLALDPLAVAIRPYKNHVHAVLGRHVVNGKLAALVEPHPGEQ